MDSASENHLNHAAGEVIVIPQSPEENFGLDLRGLCSCVLTSANEPLIITTRCTWAVFRSGGNFNSCRN